MPKKATKKHSSSKVDSVKKHAVSIEKFLKKTKNPYSEARLVDELFGIRLKKEGYVPKSNEVVKLRSIREALKLLMDQKKVVGVVQDDPVTREQELHYSLSGWYDTP